MNLHYLIGDAMQPIKKPALIAHICNDKGKWRSGFVIAVSNVSKEPEIAYLKAVDTYKGNLPLGECQVISIDSDVWVINMIAQHDTKTIDGIPPLRMDALKRCLLEVNNIATTQGATIHAPRIGAVRSGGSWADIEKVILNTLTVDTYIYTLEIEKDMWDETYEN